MIVDKKVYSFYHLNIMFSSIPVSRRIEVIEKCYWPLLRLASDAKNKISLEATGLTLEIIHELDPKWTEECKKLISLNKVEFIGSGYSQIIAPLVPGEVNRMNLVQGDIVYEQILGLNPKICLVNEMAFSFDLIDVYLSEGYESVILDLNNFQDYEKFPSERPSRLRSAGGSEIKVIWADSISFQQFQRVVHGEISYSNYESYLKRYAHSEFPLYSSDAEVFDFRPGRFKEESEIRDGEWSFIENLYENLSKIGLKFYHLQEVIDSRDDTLVYVENPTNLPIYVKKQDKYNINRWALTGRFDLLLNSYCHSLYRQFGVQNNTDIRFLLQMWSSDLRTNLSIDRVQSLEEYIRWPSEHKDNVTSNDIDSVHKSTQTVTLVNSKLRCVLDLSRGGSIRNLSCNNHNYLGWIPHGFFEDLNLAFDYFSLHSVIEPLGERKISSLHPVISCLQTKKGFDTRSKSQDYSFEQSVELDGSKIQIRKKIHFTSRRKEIIHPFIFTINPEDFDVETLYYSCANGGFQSVIRRLTRDLDMTRNYSHLITSVHSLGNSNGTLTIGDATKSVTFDVDMSISAILPKIKFIKTKDSFFLRVIYSAQEVDDTFIERNEPWTLECNMVIGFS